MPILLLFLYMIQANPFLNKILYVNPTYTSNIESSIKNTNDPVIIRNLKIAKTAGSAFWLDKMDKVNPMDTSLNSANGILLDAEKRMPIPLVNFMVYDLPSRDCAAAASNGEIQCSTPTCDDGLDIYRNRYIDPLYEILRKHPTVPVVLVIEPDSLPNLITNMGTPKCAISRIPYIEGVKYAITKFSTLNNVVMYLDSGHGGWLGWDNNAKPFQELITSLNVLPLIRGFSTNVAGYQPLGVMCPSVGWCLPHNNRAADACCADPCKLTTEYNGAQNELNYIQLLASLFPNKYFITDTGRNGVPSARSSCKNWCNADRAGYGQYPTTLTNNNLVDAFLWLKTPGESDGCAPSSSTCIRYDYMCSSVDSLVPAPEAGSWFERQVHMLAKNANFGVFTPPVPSPMPSPSPVPSPMPSPSPVPSPMPSPSPVPSPMPSPSPVPSPMPSPSPVPSPMPSPSPKKYRCGICTPL